MRVHVQLNVTLGRTYATPPSRSFCIAIGIVFTFCVAIGIVVTFCIAIGIVFISNSASGQSAMVIPRESLTIRSCCWFNYASVGADYANVWPNNDQRA